MTCVPNRPWELFYRIAPILGLSVVGVDPNDNLQNMKKKTLNPKQLLWKVRTKCPMWNLWHSFQRQCPPILYVYELSLWALDFFLTIKDDMRFSLFVSIALQYYVSTWNTSHAYTPWYTLRKFKKAISLETETLFYKLLGSSGIDSVSLCSWRAGTTTLFLLSSSTRRLF